MRPFSPTQTVKSSPVRRGGFTLIELLVSMTIILILTGLVVSTIAISIDYDRIRTASRQVQSGLEGGRDRAIFAQEPRGVRFLLDPNSAPARPIVSSMVFVGAPDDETGTLDLTDADTLTFSTSDNGRTWDALATRGLLTEGSRIKIIPANTTASGPGFWYPIDASSFASDGTLVTAGQLELTTGYVDPNNATPTFPITALQFELEMAPTPLPEEDPLTLPSGIVIDLNDSQLPTSWSTGLRDILFTPRGTAHGALASENLIHLVLADVEDIERRLPLQPATWAASTSYIVGDWIVPFASSTDFYRCTIAGTSGASSPTWPINAEGDAVTDGTAEWTLFRRHGEVILVTMFAQTGHISTHPINPGDPYEFAESGDVAR